MATLATTGRIVDLDAVDGAILANIRQVAQHGGTADPWQDIHELRALRQYVTERGVSEAPDGWARCWSDVAVAAPVAALSV